MKTRQYMICEKCGFPITDSHGIIICGNIYRIDRHDINKRPGVIGNNIHLDDIGETGRIDEVPYHKQCFLDIIWKE